MKKISILTLALLFAVSSSAMITTPPTGGTTGGTTKNTAKYNVTLTAKGNAKGYFTTNPFVGLGAGKTVKVEKGTVLKITATPSNLAQVTNWGGDCNNATGTVCTITVDGPKTVFAAFNLKEKAIGQEGMINASSSCAIAALTKKDTAAITAVQKYATDWVATINARNTAQKLALAKTGTERVTAMKAATASSTAAQRQITRALTDAKNVAKSVYRSEMKVCGYINDVSDDED